MRLLMYFFQEILQRLNKVEKKVGKISEEVLSNKQESKVSIRSIFPVAHSSIPTLLYSPWEKISNSKSFKSQKFSI